jgi:serine/threonine protein kinase/Tfp pilus assembly protein PilF
MKLAAGTRLGPYEILALLGAGGMGEVYKARDTRLDRTVAIKVMGATTSGDPAMRERLLREARAASALNHPHICTVHDVGDQDGRPFIAMEWIDGESLADRLRRVSGPVPLDDLLRLAAQIADGLEAAHASGVVHRDLKPANLFITKRGDAKILDFGLAKVAQGFSPAGPGSPEGLRYGLTDQATVAAERKLTSAGDAVGTVSYMAPEQARGETVDARSDLFSLGVVLYEMATGRSAFTGPTTALTFDAILNRQPASPRDVNGDVPAALDRIISRLLAKDPAARHQSATLLREEIESLRHDRHHDRERSSGSTKVAPSVAVLPFTNLSPEPENEYIADGITEEIINTLAQLKGLQVAARTSSFAFKGKTPDLADVAAKLHVAHVVTGSVRKAGPRLRITVQLVNTADGFPIWSERYDRQTDDIFQIQDEIATAIAEKLRVALTGSADARLVKRPTDNVTAYELYLKGRFCINQRGAAMSQALEYFGQALALDPEYALAHAGIATVLPLLAFYGYLPAYDAMPKARRAALTSIGLDGSLAEPHAALILVAWMYDWDFADADRAFGRAVALDDRLTHAYQWRALQMATSGRFDEAMTAATRAIELDPLSGSAHSTRSTCCVFGARFDEAEPMARHALDLDPQLWIAMRMRAKALSELGRDAAAVAQLEHALSLSDRHHWLLQDLAEVHHVQGRHASAVPLCEEMIERARSARYVPPLSVSMAMGILGREQDMFDWLERAYREHDSLHVLNYWPNRIVTDRARLAVLLRRIGLAPSPQFGEER